MKTKGTKRDERGCHKVEAIIVGSSNMSWIGRSRFNYTKIYTSEHNFVVNVGQIVYGPEAQSTNA